MRIGSNTDSLVNIHRINQSINHNSKASGIEHQKEIKDTVSISPMGRASSLVDSLMKQKQKIIENKEKFIGSTLEKGGTLESIKSQLESYEEQIQNIDEQISKTLFEQSKLNDTKIKQDNNAPPKTKEDVQAERLNTIVSSSSHLSQVKTSSSVRDQMEGQSRVLEIEIKLDGSRGGASKSKHAELSEINSRISKLKQSIGESIGELNENINNNTEIKQIKPEDSDAKDESKIKINFEDNNDKSPHHVTFPIR